MIDLCADYATFDSAEKISKLSLEYENYNKLMQKEMTSEWNIKKRKRDEIEGGTESAA